MIPAEVAEVEALNQIKGAIIVQGLSFPTSLDLVRQFTE